MAEREGMPALAALAGQTVARVASTDAWEDAKNRIAHVFACGNTETMHRAEGRLEKTRTQLRAAISPDREQLTTLLAVEWQVRLTDLLEDHPEVEQDLRTLVDRIQIHLVQVAGSSGIQAAEAPDEGFAGAVGSEAPRPVEGQEGGGNPT